MKTTSTQLNPFYILFIFLGLFFTVACHQKENKKPQIKEERKKYYGLENEDHLKLTEISKYQDSIKLSVMADIETDPVSASSLEDAADDPAIWVNPTKSSESIVFGSNKRGGIVAYDLKGKEKKYYPTGRVNNIDVLDHLIASDSTVQLLGCSNRSSQSIDLYYISENGELTPARKKQFKVDGNKIDDIYGFCFGTDIKQKKDYVFINGKNGVMQQFLITLDSDSIILEEKRTIEFGDQTEGMVAENESGILYVGAENTGVYKLAIDPGKPFEKILVAQSGNTNPYIKYDVEGLTIATYKSQKILMVSSQGNFSYSLFNLSNNDQYLGSIKIIDGGIIDGTEDTDGIDVEVVSLGNIFPNGVFVVQDGYNFRGDSLQAQNFKYIDFRKIESLLDKLL